MRWSDERSMIASNADEVAGGGCTNGTPRTGAICGARGRWRAASFCSQLMVASRRRRFSCVTSSTACAAERAARSQASPSASRRDASAPAPECVVLDPECTRVERSARPNPTRAIVGHRSGGAKSVGAKSGGDSGVASRQAAAPSSRIARNSKRSRCAASALSSLHGSSHANCGGDGSAGFSSTTPCRSCRGPEADRSRSR